MASQRRLDVASIRHGGISHLGSRPYVDVVKRVGFAGAELEDLACRAPIWSSTATLWWSLGLRAW
jgi:hypothetical protein